MIDSERVFGLAVEHPPLTREARVRFPGRVIPKTLKWNLPTLCVMLHISNGVRETSQ
ncbi:hypothetical protein HOLleu_20256 [Holothuria leucospilota]|uniref:Uncharacterized protein n=1 Tax=Holothuria leucospilota TaxID=206669 RepID=A0A9Q1C178_HOLLE|nr:hypothetical protein HOLleu_20256 [Holothuria leucospilota]